MPSPSVSIIIPYFNDLDGLTRLLPSIQSQSLKEVEVILVDDCSDILCHDLLEEHRRQGMNIQYIRNPRKLYTKNSRLAGVTRAQADIIAFADSDDALWGNDSLELSCRCIRETGADILHIKSMVVMEGKPPQPFPEADPLAPELFGANIFDIYVGKHLPAAPLWTKLFTRDLWCRILPLAQDGYPALYYEDHYLTAALMFYAKKYVAADHVAYCHFFRNRAVQKAVGRALTLHHMIHELVPVFRRERDSGSIRQFEKLLRTRIRGNIQNAMEFATQNGNLENLNPLHSKDEYTLFLEIAQSELYKKKPAASSQACGSRTEISKNEPKIKIACQIIGGLGDALISCAWLEELYRHIAAPLQIDVYGNVTHLALLTHLKGFISACYPGALYPEARGYDIKLDIFHGVTVNEATPSVSAQAPDLSNYVKKLQAFQAYRKKHFPKPNSSICFHPYMEYCVLRGLTRWSKLGAAGLFPFNEDLRFAHHLDWSTFEVMDQLGLRNRAYITVNCGVDDSYAGFIHVKTWPVERWNEFCAIFKKANPNVMIVQLSGKNTQVIKDADLSLCGSLPLSQAQIVLKHALVHVDTEGGLVHLRHLLRGRSVVLFGPTPAAHFAYAGNINIVSPFCSPCLWMTQDWMQKCIRGFDRPECMMRINVETVAREAKKAIASRPKYTYSVSDFDLYTTEGRENFEPILNELLTVCGLPKRPVSEHITGGACRSYVHASKQWEYPYAIRHIAALGRSGLKIGDVGGGRGALSWYLAEKGHDVTVYDIDFKWDDGGAPLIEQQFIRFAASRGFKAAFGSIFNIPAADDFFDVVTCISVVEHVEHKFYAFKELLRVLKPGGRLIVTYDLVLSDNLNQASQRKEIFTPAGIVGCLRQLGITVDIAHTTEDVEASIRCVSADRLRVKAKKLTFGAFVIHKSL